MPLVLSSTESDFKKLDSEFERIRENLRRSSLSHEECRNIREMALRIVADLDKRPSMSPSEIASPSPFAMLEGNDELRLVTDLVDLPGDALCLAATCRKFRDAVYACHPANKYIRDVSLCTEGLPPRLAAEHLRGMCRFVPDHNDHVSSVARATWAHESLGMPYDERLCDAAAANGSLEVIKEAHRLKCGWHEGTCALAARKGHLHVLQWMRSLQPASDRCPWDAETCQEAAAGGHIEVLRWARQRKCAWDERACEQAAMHGHLEALQWLRKNACPWDESTVSAALEGPDRHDRDDESVPPERSEAIFFWAVEQGCPVDWHEACAGAAASGLVAALEWLLRDELHPTTSEIQNTILNEALDREHLSVLDWAWGRWVTLEEGTNPHPDEIAKVERVERWLLKTAAESARLAVLDWAIGKGLPRHCNADVVTFGAARSAMYEYGHQKWLKVFQWAHAKELPWHPNVCRMLIGSGNLKALQWVRQAGCPWGVRPLKSFEPLAAGDTSFRNPNAAAIWALDNGAPAIKPSELPEHPSLDDELHIHDVHYHADVYDPFEDDGGMSGEDEGDLHDVDDDEADFDDEGEDGYVDDLEDDDW